MLGLLVYIGIVFFFLRLMRMLHERDRELLQDRDAFQAARPREKGFLAFLDQVRQGV